MASDFSLLADSIEAYPQMATAGPSGTFVFHGVSDANKETVEKLNGLMLRVLAAAPVSEHTHFRVKAPRSILGQEFVATLKDVAPCPDFEEAEHLATMLLRYGFVYPIFEEDLLNVRNDGTLYRIQRPYFWPWTSKIVSNIEYAIFLHKRVLRSERHGLNEEEAECYNLYLELLGHQWRFVTEQAESRLKSHKKKEKIERVIYDSDERAFWRLRKPGSNALEEPPNKLLKKLRKPTAEMLKKEIEIMEKALRNKPWLQAEPSQQRMITTVTQMQQFDPMFSPPQPSNPWISDDPTYFALNSDTADIPTESKVREWTVGFKFLMFNKMGRQAFESFLETEFSRENIRFWNAVQDLKRAPIRLVDEKVKQIYDEFMAPDGKSPINVEISTREQVEKMLREGKRKRYAFSAAEDDIYYLMERDAYPRFVRSDFYKDLLKSAQQPGSKRTWKNLLKSKTKALQPSASQQKAQREDESQESPSTDSVAAAWVQQLKLEETGLSEQAE